MSFRIALGSCSVRGARPTGLQAELAKCVAASLEALRSYDATTLRALPPEQTTHVTIEGGTASVTTIREETENGVIVVVQAFAPTIKFPSYISFSAIGHLIAEGIIIAAEGGITEAPEELMWGYR